MTARSTILSAWKKTVITKIVDNYRKLHAKVSKWNFIYLETRYCMQNCNLDFQSQKRGKIKSKCKSKLQDFVISSCIFIPKFIWSFKVKTVLIVDFILHAKLKSWFFKSEKGHNPGKMQLWAFVIWCWTFNLNNFLKFQSYNCLSCGDRILHAKL